MKQLHGWNVTPRAAIALQKRLRALVIARGRLHHVRHVAGTDVGYERGGAVSRAAVAVLTFPGLQLADYAIARQPARFPYVPGLLSFRETPPVLAALRKLSVRPDLILCDGQGLAHPRRCGFASHLGLWSGIPTIGVAKTRLVGEYETPPQRRGAWTPLLDHGETIGAVLRSKPGVKPIFVSIGHRVNLVTAVRYALACVTRFRLPETTRWAHRLASTPPRELKRLRLDAPARFRHASGKAGRPRGAATG